MSGSTSLGHRAVRPRARLLIGVFALAAAVMALVGASPALAGLQKEFAAFSQCPTSTPGVTQCIFSETVSGEFKVGSKAVPVNKPVLLSGGIKGTGAGELIDAQMSKTPLVVPGGLAGSELELAVGGNLNEVTATSELAGPVQINPSALTTEQGTAVLLPFKVKLDNPSLGETCYIGSDTEPITTQLTSGETSPPSGTAPIHGSSGSVVVKGDGKINTFLNSLLVDNAFAAPGVNGCSEPGSAGADPLVDASAGLPSAAGTNVARLGGTTEEAGAIDVEAERALPELGRCVKVPKGAKSKAPAVYEFADSGCSYRSYPGLGLYEFIPGPGAGNHFTGSSLTMKLETANGRKITCLGSTSSGEYTGAKTATIAFSLTGCTGLASKEACHTAGAAAGEITTPTLAAELGFIKDQVIENNLVATVGWDLTHSGTIISATCGAGEVPVTVSGSVIAPIGSTDKSVAAFSLKPKASAGKQVPEAFEEQANDTLSSEIGSGSAEPIGLTGAEKLTNQEKLDIKVAAFG